MSTYRQHWEGSTLVYTPNDPELEGWSLRRVLHDRSGKFPYYQPVKDNKPVGGRESGLRQAKQALEKLAREAALDEQIRQGG